MSHASQQYAFTEPRTVKRAQVKPSEREHQTSSSAPRVSLAPAADRTLDILEFIASNGQTQAATLARELGIPRSTVYQLLEILERHGLVTRLALSSARTASDSRLSSWDRPILVNIVYRRSRIRCWRVLLTRPAKTDIWPCCTATKSFM